MTELFLFGPAITVLGVCSVLACLRIPYRLLRHLNRWLVALMALVIMWALFTCGMIAYFFLRPAPPILYPMIGWSLLKTFAMGGFVIWVSCRAEREGGVVYRSVS